MREKGQTELAKTLETPVFSRGIEILTEKLLFYKHTFLIHVEQRLEIVLWSTIVKHVFPIER